MTYYLLYVILIFIFISYIEKYIDGHLHLCQNRFTTDQVLQMLAGLQSMHPHASPVANSGEDSTTNNVLDNDMGDKVLHKMLGYLIEQLYMSANVDATSLEASARRAVSGAGKGVMSPFRTQESVVSSGLSRHRYSPGGPNLMRTQGIYVDAPSGVSGLALDSYEASAPQFEHVSGRGGKSRLMRLVLQPQKHLNLSPSQLGLSIFCSHVLFWFSCFYKNANRKINYVDSRFRLQRRHCGAILQIEFSFSGE